MRGHFWEYLKEYATHKINYSVKRFFCGKKDFHRKQYLMGG